VAFRSEDRNDEGRDADGAVEGGSIGESSFSLGAERRPTTITGMMVFCGGERGEADAGVVGAVEVLATVDSVGDAVGVAV
jgi:hypothetical protein